MVQGGWYYDPSQEYPDGATCPYCSLSLDCWDVGDDPTEQHFKRADNCLFFALKEYYHPAQTKKPKAARSKRASTRSSNASTMSKKNTRTKKGATNTTGKPLPAPPDETMTDSIVASIPDTTNASMVSVTAPAPAKRGRKTKKASNADETMASVADSTVGGFGLSMMSIPPKAPPAKRGRKPKNSSILEDPPAQSFAESVPEPVEPAPAKAPVKKGRKANNAAPRTEIPDSFAESFAGSVASTMSKTTAKGRQTRKTTKRTSTVSVAPSTRSTRGAKRKSDEMDIDADAGTEAEAEVEMDVEMDVEVEEQRPSPKRTRLSSRLSDISLPQFESTPLHTPKEYKKEAIKSPISHIKSGTPKAATPRTAVRPTPTLRSPFQSFVNSPLGARSPIRPRQQTPEEPQTPAAAPPGEWQWDPVIISNIITDAGLDQENADIDLGDTSENITKAVLTSLTSPEKRMTIEEFVLYNAKRGEEKLRRECERQIKAFEAEGRRALAALDAY